ncbi:hypothetical protein F4775DRAFT_489115 [Biscogniauxia sp. FL1348]|nr:hypothetical protein F4775DRAFT_489115 [Biscogniauxia sp. FL1348]
MNFGASFLSKIRLGEGGMSSFIPHSPPTRVDEHDLSELSPRPDHALLSPNPAREFYYQDGALGGSGLAVGNTTIAAHASVKGEGKGKATAIAYPDSTKPTYLPYAVGDSIYGHTKGEKAAKRSQKEYKGPDIWRPTLPSEFHDPRDPRTLNVGPHMSFLESMFMVRRNSSDRASNSHIDRTFRQIQRRERQLHQELQKLLDAQSAALEREMRDLSKDDKRAGTSASSSTSTKSSPPGGYVMPVRQPKNKPLSKREARVGITRCMSMLSDLKNEEDAYIATALAERKAALSRLRNLSTQKRCITAELEAIESDRDQPIESNIKMLEQQHRVVVDDIEKCEQRLRELKKEKALLENKIQETKSIRDSTLSGYQGALKECDRGIYDIMKWPGVEVLEVDDLTAQDEDLKALVDKHISGYQFLSLRPERRTMDMAKDWWEGEVQILERRKAAVDKERTALEEGSQLWRDTLRLLSAQDAQLSFSMGVIAKYSYRQLTPEFSEPGEILQKQYKLCKTTIKELEDLYGYTEAQGWNLLVAAIGAELDFFAGLKSHLGETLEIAGYADGVVTPARSSSPTKMANGGNLVDLHEQDTKGVEEKHAEQEELSGSVVRRWGGAEEPNNVPEDLLVNHKEESDNEVPPGLLNETADTHHGSDDEQPNEVPPEFLSLHSPQQKKGKPKEIVTPKEEQEEHHHRLSRESSTNEVPSDLLAESGHDT